ncbi:MAG: type I-F CRISPR-associated protein Csy2 [Waddliaceae bacterium]
MKSLLILPRIKVKNANAISGITYGFPAVTHFLGYAHTLSRELEAERRRSREFKAERELKLGGCGIVCHDFQIHAHKTEHWGDYNFSLTRNPLTEEGKSESFNEEGRIHMEVSLVIECDFTSDDFDFSTDDASQDIQKFIELVSRLATPKRLAGGIITGMSPVKFHEIPEIENKAWPFYPKELNRLLPGFVLCDQSDNFKHYLSENPKINTFEALLDFYTLKSRSLTPKEKGFESDNVKWNLIPKLFRGWIVPIQVGYKAISPLYEKGEVACARDMNVPFRFVEAVYGLGEWVGLHRIKDIGSIIWRYHYEQDMYVCSNKTNF